MAITGDGLDIKGIGQVLADNVFRVPPNQRSYMWQEENVSDYWNDILNAMNDQDNNDYFIGTIVLSRTDGNTLEVVDGQQRLATTAIILASIRDFFVETKAEKRASLIETKYLINSNEDTLEDEPHLALNVDDDQFFQTHVVKRSSSPTRQNPIDSKPRKRLKDSIKNIAIACKSVRDSVFQHVGPRAADASTRLMRIIKYIREHVKVICVTVPDNESAYTIFETLNDRGLDLTKADLLKNHLFRTAKTREKEAQAKWAQMIAGLETVTSRDIAVDYIRYWWISTNGHVRGKELYAKIKGKVTEQGSAIELANDLADSAIVYAAILNSDHPRWEEYGENTRADLSNLIMLGIERIHPITLAVARTFKSPEEVRKSLYYLVAASVRLLIAGPAPGGQFEKSVADVAPKISDGTIKTASELAKEMNKEIVPADAEFKAAFSVATVSQTHLARYYLRALENGFDSAEMNPARVQRQLKGNVEHILPLSRPAEWGHVKEDVAKACCKRIGNLTLLTPKENSAVGNGDFLSVKVPVYRTCTFQMTQAIADTKQWDDKAIESRQQTLAELAVKVWGIKSK